MKRTDSITDFKKKKILTSEKKLFDLFRLQGMPARFSFLFAFPFFRRFLIFRSKLNLNQRQARQQPTSSSAKIVITKRHFLQAFLWKNRVATNVETGTSRHRSEKKTSSFHPDRIRHRYITVYIVSSFFILSKDFSNQV